MFSKGYSFLRVLGIEIRIDASWILIALLVTWSFAQQLLPSRIPDLTGAQAVVLGLIAMLLFFLSLLLHEFAHALTARFCGLSVPRITLFLFGGVAELEDEPRQASDELWIALAGPAMSFALALGFWLVALIVGAVAPLSAVAVVSGQLALVNLVLGVFNLIPAFPLDGGRVLRALVWSRSGDLLAATRTATWSGTLFAYLLIASGIVLLFQGAEIGGAWQIMIGVFVFLAARGSYEALKIKLLLGSSTVDELMTPAPQIVGPELTLDELVNTVMLPQRVSFLPVVEDGSLLGYIDSEVLSKIDRENWANTRVGDVFAELSDETNLPPGLRAEDVLKRISETGRRKFLVAEGRRLKGIITLSDLSRYLGLMTDLHLSARKAHP